MTDTMILSFDSLAYAALACLALREIFVATLPDHLAGPGGCLVDTRPRSRPVSRSTD